MSHKFTRLELYQLVWSEPLRKLGQRFGISDVAIAKRCRRSNIPLPGVGYWAKKETGKQVLQPPFPPRGLGQSDIVIIGGKHRYSWAPQESDKELLAATITPPPPFPEGLPEIAARAKELVGRVRAIASLANAHPSITRLLQEDEQRREKQKASRYPSSFDAPLFDSRFERRRLRLMNSLMLAFVRCGCAPSLGREIGSVSIHVGDERIGFSIGPLNGKPERQYPPKQIPADAKMKIDLGWHQPPPEIKVRWQDKDNAPLEDQLHEVAVGLIVAGEWAYRRSILRQYEHRLCRQKRLKDEIRRKEEEAARRERERLEKIEADRRNQLIREMLAWRRASDIRRYVEAQLTRRKPHAGAETLASLESWASWAIAEADRIDPILHDVLPGMAR
ncbi:MAG: hypothetical protein WD823_12605 [Sulfuricaulis sp.]|uniref:hypothetical protein n=1 Tax=Sulfuricaulis sp. TaxID=2003553 RepID=UPI0034A104A3